MRLTYNIEGAERLEAALDDLELTFKDFRALFRSAGRLFYEFEREAFLTEGASSAAGKWADLSTNYRRWKEINAPGKTILRRTDRLYRSLTSPNAPGSTQRIEENRAEFGTTVEYAGFHQSGTRTMPARPVIALTREQERQIGILVRDGLAVVCRRAGFITSVEET